MAEPTPRPWQPANWPAPRRPTSVDDPRCEDYSPASRALWAMDDDGPSPDEPEWP